MNPTELLRSVDNLARERGLSREVIFTSIEKAVRLAILKRFDEEEGVEVSIDRDTGVLEARKGDQLLDIADLGRIPAMSGRNVMFQSFKEEESNNLFDTYSAQKGDLVHGTIQRFEGGSAIVALGKHEALLPRGEQIPGETHHVGERVKAIILEVRKTGHRVRIILSRSHPVFVRRLFEDEIPEIQDQTISIKAVAREAGYRSKVAVSSIDMKVDAVGACVGVRGNRIKNVIEELNNERIDIIRWNDSLQVLIINALQPANIEDVMLYPRLGRAIVLVQEDQLSLAIGRRGQNVRLASKLVGWDIEIMTHDELSEGIERAENWFREIPGIADEVVEAFIEEGFLSYDDLTFIEPAELAELAGVSEEEAENIIAFAEEASERVEVETKRTRDQDDGEGRATPVSAAERLFAPLADSEPIQEEEPKLTADRLFGPQDSVTQAAEEESSEESGEEEPSEEALESSEEEPSEEAWEESSEESGEEVIMEEAPPSDEPAEEKLAALVEEEAGGEAQGEDEPEEFPPGEEPEWEENRGE